MGAEIFMFINSGKSGSDSHFAKLQHVWSVEGVCGFHIGMGNLGFRDLSLKSAAAKLEFKSRSHPFKSSLISMPCGLDEAKPGDPGDRWRKGRKLGRGARVWKDSSQCHQASCSTHSSLLTKGLGPSVVLKSDRHFP